MSDLPSHPDSDDSATAPRLDDVGRRPAWVRSLLIGVPVVLVVAFIVLHLTGVLGPGA